MVKVPTKITIKAAPTNDTYSRYHGKSIDVPMKVRWVEEQPELKLKNPDGTDLISKTAFTHAQTVDLEEGDHTIQYAPSNYRESGLFWKAEILINDKSLGEQTDLCRDAPYTATFKVAKPPPTLAETISGVMGTFVSMMMLVMIISLMTSMLKAFKKE